MKQVIIASATLLMLILAIIFNNAYLNSFVHETLKMLNSTVDFVKNEDLKNAEIEFKKAKDNIKKHESYLSMILMHAEIDEINLALSSANEFLNFGEMPEFFSEMSNLSILIEHIVSLEELNIRNIL